LDKRRDQQTRTESKTRLVVRVNMCLSSGDYARAVELLRGAVDEFPNDAELSELEKLAQAGVSRKAEADRLITESQELFAQQKSAKALQLLREAYGLDKTNSLSRAILANALVEHAQSIVETDWWEAETLANEALALNPVHPTAKTIEGLILSRKMAASVDEWVSQTRKLQSSGNLSAALSQIAEGFAIYPHESRLLQIQDAIQRDLGAERRQARRRDLEDLRRTASEVDAAADTAAKQALAERIKGVTVKYSTDGEILSVANALLLRLGQAGVRQKSAAAAASEGATVVSQAAVPKVPDASLAATIPFAPKPLPAGRGTSGTVRPSKGSTKIAPAKIAPTTTPPIAAVPVGKVAPAIAPPSRVPQAAPEPQPAPSPAVTVPAAEPAAPAAKIKAPSFRPIEEPRSNSTPLIVGCAAVVIIAAAIFFFTRKHDAPPVATTSAAAPSVAAPAVSASTVAAPAQSTPEPSIPKPSAPAPQPSSDTVEKAAPVDEPSTAAAPTPSPAVESGHNLGTIVVVAGQDKAKVFINGKLQGQLTQGGQLRLPNLELKDYVVQVSKSGFQDPPQQKIRIRGGEQARLVFNLQPNVQPQPRLATLTIQGGAPGTTVLVDQTPVGAVQADGTLSVSSVNPGDHTVELRRERFKPRQFKKHFVAGGAISLAPADTVLEAGPAELKITFTPADAKVAIAKTGALPTMVSSGVPLNLAPGTYTLTARTAERFTRSSTLEVVAGQSKTLDLSLAPNGMSKWVDAGAWKHEKDAFVRQGGDFVLFGVVPTSGSFAFSAMVTKGHLLQWVFNYTDPKNYVLFQMDENNFYRSVIRNGKKTDEIIVPDKGDKKSFRVLHIRVSPTEIVHQIGHGDSWTVLDRWTQPGANLSLGKFGFYIPGNDQVAVSGFAHYADLNLR
jgi:tetratricopeptide (TPR) repeat protein